jgi:hypothetical protein
MLVEEFDDLVGVVSEEKVAARVYLHVERAGGVPGPGLGLVRAGFGIAVARQDGNRAGDGDVGSASVGLGSPVIGS